MKAPVAAFGIFYSTDWYFLEVTSRCFYESTNSVLWKRQKTQLVLSWRHQLLLFCRHQLYRRAWVNTAPGVNWTELTDQQSRAEDKSHVRTVTWQPSRSSTTDVLVASPQGRRSFEVWGCIEYWLSEQDRVLMAKGSLALNVVVLSTWLTSSWYVLASSPVNEPTTES